jgi:hypothetical protein
MYKAGGMIRAMAWHPIVPRTLILGAANGDINKLVFARRRPKVFLELQEPGTTNTDYSCPYMQNDIWATENIPGFIHILAFNPDGSQLTVAFSDKPRLALITTATFSL